MKSSFIKKGKKLILYILNCSMISICIICMMSVLFVFIVEGITFIVIG